MTIQEKYSKLEEILKGFASVSVIVPNSMNHAGLISDAYSTASFVTGNSNYETIIFK